MLTSFHASSDLKHNLDNGLSHDTPILDLTQNISESVLSLNENDLDTLETEDVVLQNMTENILHENQVELKNADNKNTAEDDNIFEQDIRDVLFEAGYSIEEIQAAKTKSCSSESVTESDIDQNEITESDIDQDDFTEDNSCNNQAHSLLKEVRIKNINRLIIGTLNINSLASKFEQLKLVMKNTLDVLILQETKLDSSFPPGQFILEGYSQPYRLDRNRNGGGVMIYVKENIPSKQLTKHAFT